MERTPSNDFARAVALAGAGFALSFGPVARAGLKTPVPVTISATQAYGGAGSARNSSDAKQRIDCEFIGTTTGTGIYCFAVDATGKQAACGSSNPSFMSAARKFQPDSMILFDFDASATCLDLQVLTASQLEPKKP